MWMVRAGEGGTLIDDFRNDSLVAIGWEPLGDMQRYATRADFTAAIAAHLGPLKAGQRAAAAGQTYRFVREMQTGDHVVSYDASARSYLLGEITGAYAHRPEAAAGLTNVRTVLWRANVARDRLSVAARNSLGAISTLFLLPEAVAREMLALAHTRAQAAQATSATPEPTAEEESEDLYRDMQAKGFEFTKDRVNALDWVEMQELVAGLLRAMGYKTRISPSGSDRGKDIVASPDGLGFEDPRIIVEVKHREAAMGSQEIRSFLGGRHDHDKGLYVSTGGFTKDARYEAERGRIPITLMDLDDLVKALLEHYEQLDVEMQRLIPLRKVYWPA